MAQTSHPPRPVARGGDRLSVVTLDPESDERWAAFVASRHDALVYQHPLWLRTLRREYPQDAVALACLADDGRVVGVLPLLRTRGLPLGVGGPHASRRLASLPRTPLAGPLAADARVAMALLEASVALVRGEPGTRLEVKVATDGLPAAIGPLGSFAWRESFSLELPSDPASLRFGNARNHARIKWAVKKAERVGVRVRPAETAAELRAWYRTYLETMRVHAVPPRPLRLFEAMWDLLRPAGMMRLLLAVEGAWAASRILAGSVFLQYGSTAFYAFNGRRGDALALRPNDAILYRAIHDAARDGFRRFDLGEVARGGDGLADFKRKWGASSVTLSRYQFPVAPQASGGEAGEGAGLIAFARKAWRRLPLGITAVMGDHLYRFL